jgi:hypothetical protein
MNWMQSLWVAVAFISLVAILLLAFQLRRRTKRSTPAVKTAWLVAATASATMLVFIAAQVIAVIPNATVIDVGALAITGVLTGLFLAFALMPTHTGAADR